MMIKSILVYCQSYKALLNTPIITESNNTCQKYRYILAFYSDSNIQKGINREDNAN